MTYVGAHTPHTQSRAVLTTRGQNAPQAKQWLVGSSSRRRKPRRLLCERRLRGTTVWHPLKMLQESPQAHRNKHGGTNGRRTMWLLRGDVKKRAATSSTKFCA